MGMLVVLGLVFFHSAQIFAYSDFYVKNEPPNMQHLSQILSTIFIAFAGLWGMPLLFLLAGIAIWHSLRKRTAAEFVVERTKRLLIPLVVGTLLLVPPLVYFQLKSDPAYQESYLQFLPRFFNVKLDLDFPRFITGAPPDELFQTGHLYFLNYLFAFTLLLLPLWLYLQRPRGQRRVARAAAFLALPWAIFILALPIAAIEAALGVEYAGGWNRYAYIPFIVYGFLIAADPRIGKAIQQQWKKALVLGVITLLIYLAGSYMMGPVIQFDGQTDYGLGPVLFRFFKGVTGWLWVVAIMGLIMHLSHRAARRKQPSPAVAVTPDKPDSQPPNTTARPSFTDRLARYAGEAQLPFYVLHMTAIVVIGFYVVQLNVNPLIKYGAICLAVLVVTLLVYDIGVRRTKPTRFLFGMRTKKPRTSAQQASPTEPGTGAGLARK
jgi:hypothetical protein